MFEVADKNVESAFYEQGSLRLYEYERTHSLQCDSVKLSHVFVENNATRPDQNAIDEAMCQLAMSRMVLREGDSTYDVGFINRSGTKGTILLPATANSSLDNAGNGYETAVLAARYPDYTVAYVASPGSGASSPMPKADAEYYKKYGRLVRGQGDEAQAVVYVTNMYRALSRRGIDVTHFSADSTGNQYAQAFGVAMEDGQLQAAHFSESTGFVAHSLPSIAKRMVYDEDRVNKAINIASSLDPDKLTDDMQDQYRQAAKLYMSQVAIDNIARLRPSALGRMSGFWTNLQGLRKGPSEDSFPLVDDANALVARQPQARLVYSLSELDPLYKDPQTAHEVALRFIGSLTLPESANVRSLLIPAMTHKINTYHPNLYHAVKRYALGIQ